MARLIDITGKAISGEWGTDDLDGSGIPVLRTTNFTNTGEVSYANVVTRSITKKNISNKFLRKGDIIIEKSGGSDKQPVGRVIYFEGEENKYLFNNFTGLLRVVNSQKWYSKYVFYSLYAYYQKGGTRAFENKTTGLHNLKLENYLNAVEVRNLSLEIQVQRSFELDKLRKIITLRRTQLAKLDELVKCRFVEMFGDPVTNPKGWEEETLGTTCEVVSGATPKTEKEEYWNGENFWITPAELSDEDFIITKTERTLSDLGVRSSSLKLLPIGTVLLSSRAPIGKLAIVGTPMYCNQGFKNLICGPRLKTIFLWAFLRERKKYLISLGRGATFKEISKSIVESIPIPVPPLSLQAEFARFVEAVDKSKFAVRQSLEKLNVCYKSLMQEYFG